MSSLLEHIIKGKEVKPRRTFVYGTQGIGKSSWAANSTNPIFIPTEDGLNEIDCEKFPVAKAFEDVMNALSALYTDKHGYKTIVIDSVDWLERMIWAEVCRKREVGSIDDIGYGKGYGFSLTHWQDFIVGLEALRSEKKLAIVLIAHAKIERFENPETDSYDRYTPRIHKTAAALLQEWADEVLFASYKVHTRQTGEGISKKSKGIGTGERVIRTQERPSHLAKNRLNLPDELPLEWGAYAKYFNGKPKTATKKEKAEKAKA